MTAPAPDLGAIRAELEGVSSDIRLTGVRERAWVRSHANALLAHIERLTAERDEARLDRANLVDDAATMERENEALRAAADAWQPIETAPRDKRVLVYCADTAQQRVAQWSKNPFTDDVAWTIEWFRDESGERLSVLCNPTHWRPLPAPPAALAGSAAP